MCQRIVCTFWIVFLAAFDAIAGTSATATATITAGYVTGIKVTSGGSGYVREPRVTIKGGGGSGATAKVVLNGDSVGLVIILSAGSGYTSSVEVLIEPPPKELEASLRIVPEITVSGAAGTLGVVMWSSSATGPWTPWTNVAVGANGMSVVDLSAGASTRFYRVVPPDTQIIPAGFVWINPGVFNMGSPDAETNRYRDETLCTVTLTQGFWLSDHEVTQAEYQSVMGSNPSFFRGAERPVEEVSWDDAMLYCAKLTENARAAGRLPAGCVYQLPTEAQWEYAARSGTTNAYAGDLDAMAWYAGDSGTHAVKTKQANAWGLYDMHGNVWEWCLDRYGDYPSTFDHKKYPSGMVIDPVGANSGSDRVFRGGGWDDEARDCRSAVRARVELVFRDEGLGFRPALILGR